LAHGSLHSSRLALPESANTRAYLSRRKLAENLNETAKNKPARNETRMIVGIPAKLNAQSEEKPNGIPG
jgi:hypothetical protein